MAYIYKKTIGEKPYYYLRVSKRVNGKQVVKDVAYLGDSVHEVERRLQNLKEFQAEIRKSYRNIRKFIQSNHYAEKVKKIKRDSHMGKVLQEKVEAARLHFNDHFLKQDQNTIQDTYKHFLIDFAFNTTSIEGNTITLKEAERLLREDILPKNKTLREVYDLQNTERAFFWTVDKSPAFNESLILKIHDMLMDNIDKRKGYRSHDIRVFRSRFDPAPAKYVKTDVNILFKSLQRWKKVLSPFALAAVFHHKLEKIHPFADGNGRTGRILLNYLLMRSGYPPLIIQKKRRGDYLDVLAKADAADLKNIGADHYVDLVEYLANELIDSYWSNFNI